MSSVTNTVHPDKKAMYVRHDNTCSPPVRDLQSPLQPPIINPSAVSSSPRKVRAKVLPPILVMAGSNKVESPPHTATLRSRYTPPAKPPGSPPPLITQTPFMPSQPSPLEVSTLTH